MKKKKWIKWLAVIATVILLVWLNRDLIHVKPQAIRDWILAFGAFAPLLYMILYTFRPLILFPASILSLTGGLAFGAVWGTVFTVIGATGSAAVAFYISRKLGREAVSKKLKGKGEAVQQQIERTGFLYVFLLRLIPVFHFDLVSYLAGLTKVKRTHFIVATFIGMIPGAAAYSLLGSSIVAADQTSIILAILFFLAVTLLPLVSSKSLRKKLGIQRDI